MDSDNVTDDWVSAAHAVRVLGMRDVEARRTICRRAHAGLLRTRAKRYFVDEKVQSDTEIPRVFWWAEGGAALEQNWLTGDFETWINRRIRLRAFGVTFSRADLEEARPLGIESVTTCYSDAMKSSKSAGRVFIGHGRSPIWRELQDFLRDRLGLKVDEFNRVAVAGVPTATRLSEMLDEASFAFLILTAEDEQPDSKIHARLNVIHEVGLFQGRKGFQRAIVLLESGCEEFSNIQGLGQIRFPKGQIGAIFEEIRRVLERERLIEAT